MTMTHTTPLPHLVIFCDPAPIPAGERLSLSRRLVWWGLHLLRPGFRHCAVLVPFAVDGSGCWLHIDPLSIGINTALCRADAPDWIMQQVQAGTAHAVWAHRSRAQLVMGGWPLTCVSVVKAVLGIRCAAITPHQLYRYLKRQEDNIMGGFFSSPSAPPEPDNSALEQQLADQKEERAKLERENAGRKRLQRSRSSGGATLRFTGAELTATPASTGGNATLGG